MKKVNGKENHKIKLFALSTCIWCKKTKELLNNLGFAYEYEDVDLLNLSERKKALNEMKKWEEESSFPLIIIDNKSIQGFNEIEIKKLLNE